MGYLYKLKPEVVGFINAQKHKNPDINCRKLATLASKKFGFKLSKSSINIILKREGLSSPIGRRSEQLLSLEGRIEHGGFCLFQGIDYQLDISKTAAELLINISPLTTRISLEDIENVFQSWLILKSIFNVTLDFTKCYNDKEIWVLVGRRPTRVVYNQIANLIQNSQLFTGQLVKEIKRHLNPIAGFRFQLRDESSFFIDAGLHSIWQIPPKVEKFFTTYYNAISYINGFLSNERVFPIFNMQGTSIFSPDILSFILSFNSQDRTKLIRQIELLDPENNIVDKKLISGVDKRFFMLGFWPWQLDIMSEFERKPAKQKLAWSELGVEFYYQIEEFIIPQHLVEQEVKLIALLLKSSPLGPARIGILTNIPKDVFANYLSYKELYHWFYPEDRFKDFTPLEKVHPVRDESLTGQADFNPVRKDSFSNGTRERSSLTGFTKKAKELISKDTSLLPTSLALFDENSDNSLDKILEVLSQVILNHFQQKFLPEGFRSWSPVKIKEVFLRQKAIIKRSKEFVIHNLIIDNRLCKEDDLRYICQRLNESGIRDGQGRLMWFK